MADDLHDSGKQMAGDPELLVRIERYLSGDASEAAVAMLDQDLFNSAENRDLFVRLANLSGLMAEHFAPPRAYAEIESTLRDITSSQELSDCAALSDAVANDKRFASQPSATGSQNGITLGFLGRSNRTSIRPLVRSILAVAAVFYGTFALISWNLRSDNQPSSMNGDAVAHVRMTGDVKWSREANRKADASAIEKDELLMIDSGLVELSLKSGAALLVEGPAEWSIDGNNRATLHSGKLVAQVPSRAVGFTLNTPTAQVVDLGTEFGVEVKESGRTRLQVFQGSVEARSTVAAAPIVRRISTGQAAEYNVQGYAPMPADAQPLVSLFRQRNKQFVGRNLKPFGPVVIKPFRGHQGAFTASDHDLINQGQPTLARATHTDYSPLQFDGLSASAEALNDGKTLSVVPQEHGALEQGAIDDDSIWTSQFDLNIDLHPEGYTIEEIRSISEWIPSRCNQQYRVWYAIVGQDEFVLLGQAYFDGNGVDGAGLVLVRREAGPLATQVRSLRFEFESPTLATTTEAGFYTELDVFGHPTTTEELPNTSSPQ